MKIIGRAGKREEENRKYITTVKKSFEDEIKMTIITIIIIVAIK